MEKHESHAVRRCRESDAEYFQYGIHDALDAPSGDAASPPDIRQLLINVDARCSGKGIVEQIFLACPIGDEGLASGIGVSDIRAERECRRLIDQPAGLRPLDANPAAALQNKRAWSVKYEIAQLHGQPRVQTEQPPVTRDEDVGIPPLQHPGKRPRLTDKRGSFGQHEHRDLAQRVPGRRHHNTRGVIGRDLHEREQAGGDTAEWQPQIEKPPGVLPRRQRGTLQVIRMDQQLMSLIQRDLA